MDLPETSILNFFNKVLISLSELSPDGDSCSVDSLIKQCRSVVFGGQRGEYESILNHCKYIGLVQVKKDQVVISALGEKFLSANRERYFEINEAQKQLITERIIFLGAWSHHARELFNSFSLNQVTETYEVSTVDTVLTKNQITATHFFKFLGILYEEAFIIKVERRYSELVYQLTADSKAISEQQLEKILMENRRLGAKAENVVVEFEKRRLRKLGKPIQAELVKRISTINTAAGYDIESFDGTTDEIFPNRFIEVKATTGDALRFYWSINEMNVAKRKKKSYWIYMIVGFKEAMPEAARPILIQNPEHSLPKHTYLAMEAHKFLIREISEVELSEHNIDDIMWYQLA